MASTIVIIALIITGLLVMSLAVYAGMRRHLGDWAVIFSFVAMAAAIWSIGYAFEMFSVALEKKLIWAQIQYIGIGIAPAAWFFFALSYTSRDKWLTRSRVMIVLSIPALTIFFAFSNNYFRLIWQTIEVVSFGRFTVLQFTYGAWFWVHIAYSYILMAMGTTALLLAFFRHGSAFRWHHSLMLIGALMPYVGNFLFVTGLNPIANLDLSPIGLGLAGVLLGFAIFRVGLFDLVPISGRVAIDSLSDALFLLDASGRIIDINPSGQQLLSINVSEVVGQPIGQLSGIGPKLASLLNNNSSAETEVAWQQRSYDVRCSQLKNQKGKINGNLLSLRDITLRKHTENLLASRNNILETLNRLSVEVTSTLELQPILDTAVKSAAELLGVTSVYISKWDPDKETLTVIAEYFAPEACAAEKVSDFGVAYSLEDDFGWPSSWMDTPDDNFIQHIDSPDTPAIEKAHMEEFGAKTVFDVPLHVKGKPIGTLELWESRHKREFSREEISLILAIARHVALAMDNARLYEQTLLASEVKSQILAQVNHELRTPLSVILLFSGMLDDGIYGKLTDNQMVANSKVMQNANYLKALVTQLLDQAEMSAEKTTLNNDPFAPHAMANDVYEQMNSLAEAKGIRLSASVADNMPTTILGDSIRVQQILINLVNNAIKFTDTGCVEVRLDKVDDKSWQLEVKDSGIGIASDHLKNIFEPFWQASDSTLAESKGVGLGLSIVDQLVTMMNGQIKATSQLDKGTTIIVTLPLQHCSDMNP